MPKCAAIRSVRQRSRATATWAPRAGEHRASVAGDGAGAAVGQGERLAMSAGVVDARATGRAALAAASRCRSTKGAGRARAAAIDGAEETLHEV